MALSTSIQSRSTGPVALPVSAFRAKRDRVVVLAAAVLVVLVEALHPAGAVFRIRHVAVISGSLAVLAAAGVAGVFHR